MKDKRGYIFLIILSLFVLVSVSFNTYTIIKHYYDSKKETTCVGPASQYIIKVKTDDNGEVHVEVED